MSFQDLLYKNSAQVPQKPYETPGGQALMAAARLAAKPINSSTQPTIEFIDQNPPQEQAAPVEDNTAQLDEANSDLAQLKEEMASLRNTNEQLKMQMDMQRQQQETARATQNEMVKLQLERERMKAEAAAERADLNEEKSKAESELTMSKAKAMMDQAAQEKKKLEASGISSATLGNLNKAIESVTAYKKRADDLTAPGARPEARTQTAPSSNTTNSAFTASASPVSTPNTPSNVFSSKVMQSEGPKAYKDPDAATMRNARSIYDNSPERMAAISGEPFREANLFGEAKQYVTTSNRLPDMARSREQMVNFITKAKDRGAGPAEIAMAEDYVSEIDKRIASTKDRYNSFANDKTYGEGSKNLWNERLNQYKDMYYKRDNMFGIGDTGSEAEKLRNAWRTSQEERERAKSNWAVKGLRFAGNLAADPFRGMANAYMDAGQVGDMASRRGVQMNWFGRNSGSDDDISSFNDAAEARGLSTNNWSYLGRGAGNAILAGSSFIPGIGWAARVGIGAAGGLGAYALGRGPDAMQQYYNTPETLPGARTFKYASWAGLRAGPPPRTTGTTGQVQNMMLPGMHASIPANPYASGFGKYLAMASPFIQSLTGGLITPVKSQPRANTLHERVPVEMMMAGSQTAADPRFLPDGVANPGIDAETAQYNSRFQTPSQQVAGTVQHFGKV